MQLRTPRVRHYGLFSLVGLIVVLCFQNKELRAEERTPSGSETANPLAEALGVSFVDGSTSSVILERDGKQYVVDLATKTIRENETPAQLAAAEPVRPLQTAQAVQASSTANSGSSIFSQQCASCHGADGKGGSGVPNLTDYRSRFGIPSQRIVDVITNGKPGTGMQGFAGRLSAAEIRDVATFVQSLSSPPSQSRIYEAPDDFVYSLPTGRRLARKGLYLNFTHRFAYNPAFSGRGLGNTLFGLDGFAVSSFGLRYGVTDRLSVSVYRAPSIIGRPIEFLAAYNVLDEHDGQPLNAAFRVSIDGQDNFRRNFTTNFEGIVSRSFTNRAQFYAVPTFSVNNRRLVSKPGALENRPAELPGINSFSVGAGLAVNIRPTLAVVTEVIPTVYHFRELGIHRPAYSFGIQKTVRGHAFTLGFSNGPGTVVAQRAGTRATYLGNESADTPKGLFFGFNLMRRLR
jgi:mono/diheme cytochrome c family protein